MLTQQDIHNILVENASDELKIQLAVKYKNDIEKVKKLEQIIADTANACSLISHNEVLDYLNKKI